MKRLEAFGLTHFIVNLRLKNNWLLKWNKM